MKNFLSKLNLGLLLGLLLFSTILLSPVPENLSPEGWKVAAIGILMAVLWATEAIPLFVTALFPLVFFPLLGISSFSETALPFSDKNIFLFLFFCLLLHSENYPIPVQFYFSEGLYLP